MAAATKSRAASKATSESPARTLIGWQGIRFTLPADWNLAAFSQEAGSGYLKVDSPGTMFAQVKWMEPGGAPRRDLIGIGIRVLRGLKLLPAATPRTPNVKAVLDSFLADTGRAAKKAKVAFESRIKPESTDGERTGHNFSWSGQGQGQGKIWHCGGCGRVVIAQVVGQARDNIAGVASVMLGSLADHSADGWNSWALYDLVAAAPSGFVLTDQKLMSGYLKLDFERRGERIRIERWALANVTLKKFTLVEWLRRTCDVRHGAATVPGTFSSRGHLFESVSQSISGIVSWVAAIRKGGLRPATRLEAAAWECEETNRIYVVQHWRNTKSDPLMDELVRRCECH